AGPAGRLHAGRRHRRRDDLHAARPRTPHPGRGARAQLPRGAERGAGRRRDVPAGEPGHRPALRRHRPSGPPALMSSAFRLALPGRPRGVTVAGLLVLTALALIATLAPHIVPGSPTEIVRDQALHPPTWSQPFGMDDLGRSILSRV